MLVLLESSFSELTFYSEVVEYGFLNEDDTLAFVAMARPSFGIELMSLYIRANHATKHAILKFIQSIAKYETCQQFLHKSGIIRTCCNYQAR